MVDGLEKLSTQNLIQPNPQNKIPTQKKLTQGVGLN